MPKSFESNPFESLFDKALTNPLSGRLVNPELFQVFIDNTIAEGQRDKWGTRRIAETLTSVDAYANFIAKLYHRIRDEAVSLSGQLGRDILEKGE